MGRGTSAFFNLMTFIFLTLTVVAGIIILGVMSGSMEPPFLAASTDEPLPTLVVQQTAPPLPTFTPSNTPVPPTETPTPTDTPTATPTTTATPTSTNTPGPTDTPTLTPTNTATFTPSPTLTFTPSPTWTFTPSPTGPTPTPTNTQSPYPFIVQQGTPLLRDNFANTAGCNWQGLAGQVVTDRGEAVVGVQVRVTGEGISEQFTITGTNTFYGPSGWEVAVDNKTNGGRYQVTLLYNNTQVSPTVEIVFPNSCQQNLALINFVQTRPFSQ